MEFLAKDVEALVHPVSQVSFDVNLSQLSESHLSSATVGGIAPALRLNLYLQSTVLELHMRDEQEFDKVIREDAVGHLC